MREEGIGPQRQEGRRDRLLAFGSWVDVGWRHPGSLRQNSIWAGFVWSFPFLYLITPARLP